MIRLDIIGHLGRDCVVRDVPNSNQKTISFSVAHSEKWRDAQGTQHEKTTWANCTLWRNADKIAIAQYLTKGTQVHVEGIPEVRAYQANDGTNKAELSVRVKDITLLGSTTRADQQPAPAQNTYGQAVQTFQQNYSNAPAPSGQATANSVPVAPPHDLHAPEQGDDLPF
jgi:single-strand DNA-binding protein